MDFLLQRHKNVSLNKGAIYESMKISPFKITQIKIIWRQASPVVVDTRVRVDFTTKKKGGLGRKTKYNQENLVTAILQTPLSQHRTLQSLTNAMSIPQ